MFSDTLTAGEVDTLSFVPGRTGTTTVAICAEPGFNFDLVVAGQTAATPSNCERVTFEAVAGQTYRAEVRAVTGDGIYGGCWSTALVECTPAPQPVACAAPAFRADTALPAGYYSSAQGKTGAALIAALDRIVCRARVLGYYAARDSMYAKVEDPDNDDLLADVYVGRVATINQRSTAAAANFNAEHSWPQSKGSAADPAMSDIHHLFPSDERQLPALEPPVWRSSSARRRGQAPTPTAMATSASRGSTRPISRYSSRATRKKATSHTRSCTSTSATTRAARRTSRSRTHLEEASLIQWSTAVRPTPSSSNELLAFRAQGTEPVHRPPGVVAAIGEFQNN